MEIRFTEVDCFRVYKDKLIRNKVLFINEYWVFFGIIKDFLFVVFITSSDYP